MLLFLHSCDTPHDYAIMGWMQLLVVLSGNSEAVAVLVNARTGFLSHIQLIPSRITHVHSVGRGQTDHSGYFMSEATIPFPKTMTVHVFPNNQVEMYPQQTMLWVSDKESGAPCLPFGF